MTGMTGMTGMTEGMLDGITVWDGTAPLGPSRLTWHHGEIGEVRESTDRFPGLSVIPGLIDTHVHLVSYAGPDFVDYLSWPLVTPSEERVLHGVAQARRALMGGVTTVRDMAAGREQVAIRRGFELGLVPGPRVFAHGIVGMTAGHGDLFTPPSVPEAFRRPSADGPDACRRLVREYARMGMDGIKITTSGGVLSVGDKNEWRNYTREEIRAIIDEAHALSLPVAAHAHTVAGIEVALEEGVDSLEHATLITREQAQMARERGITVAPTLLILDRIADGVSAAPAESRAKAQALQAGRAEALKAALEEGVELVLGTDASGHMPFGLEMDEVRAMGALGLSARSAMVAATSRAARALGQEGRLGCLKPRAGADFLVIKGRPWELLDDLRTENIVAVVARGQLMAGALPE